MTPQPRKLHQLSQHGTPQIVHPPPVLLYDRDATVRHHQISWGLPVQNIMVRALRFHVHARVEYRSRGEAWANRAYGGGAVQGALRNNRSLFPRSAIACLFWRLASARSLRNGSPSALAARRATRTISFLGAAVPRAARLSSSWTPSIKSRERHGARPHHVRATHPADPPGLSALGKGDGHFGKGRTGRPDNNRQEPGAQSFFYSLKPLRTANPIGLKLHL